MEQKGKLVVISGFSGAGKGTLMKAQVCTVGFRNYQRSETGRKRWCGLFFCDGRNV